MNFFSLKFGLSSGANQSTLMQLLKSNGAEVIQTSDGLCVKSDKTLSALKELTQPSGGEGTTWQELDPATTLSDDSVAADIKAFLKGS